MANKCPHGKEGLCEECLQASVKKAVEKEVEKEEKGKEGQN